jgi:mRNA-degrading endonuclease toxin of MazEF toxin-antitoxin module
MRRGDLWTRGDTAAYVIVASDRYDAAGLPTTWAVPLTPEAPSTVGAPFVVHLTARATGLTVPVWARVAAGIVAVPIAELDRYLGHLNPKALTQIDQALRDLFGLVDP